MNIEIYIRIMLIIAASRFEVGDALAPEETGVLAASFRPSQPGYSLGKRKRKAGQSLIEPTWDNSTSLPGKLPAQPQHAREKTGQQVCQSHTTGGILSLSLSFLCLASVDILPRGLDNDNRMHLHSHAHFESIPETQVGVASGPTDRRGSFLAILVSLVVGIIWF